MQIRNYKTSSEVRRVVKSLNNALCLDRQILASVRRSLNIASLKEETVAARVPAKTTRTVKKPAAKAPAKTATRKVAVDDSLFNTRGGPGVRGRAPGAKAPAKRAAVNIKNVDKLTRLLTTRQERLQIAEHIRQLLSLHFDKTDKTVIRLGRAVETLVKESQSLFGETEKTLNDLSTRSIASDFTSTVDEIGDALKTRFAKRYKTFNIKYSMAVKPSAEGAGATYHIAYLMFDDLHGPTTTQDYVVVLTRVSNGREERDFVRTLTDYRPPSWIVKQSPGIAFDTSKKALKVIYQTMSMEDMLDVAEPAELPVKRSQLTYQNTNVESIDVDEKQGHIKVFLKPNVDEEKAKRLLIDLFAETKALVKAVHPRYKNPVKAFQPKKIKRKLKSKTTGKIRVVEQYVIAFAFAKMDGDAPVQLPRDKVKQFMDTFDIDDPETVQDFNKLLRNFLGVR